MSSYLASLPPSLPRPSRWVWRGRARAAITAFLALPPCSVPPAAQAQQAAQAPATAMLNGHLVVSRRVLFAFNSAPSAAAIAEIKSVTGAADMRPVGGAGAYLIDSSTLDTADLIAYLSSRRDIAYAEPDSVTTRISPPTSGARPRRSR